MIPLVGTVRLSVPKPRAQSLDGTGERRILREALEARLREGAALFRACRFAEARGRFDSLRISALARGEISLAARAAGNVGGCDFAIHQYQAALTSYLEARRLAARAGDASAMAGLDANIASLYSETGQLEGAAEWIEGTAERLSGRDRMRHLPRLLIQKATIRARQGRLPEAMDLFGQGIEAADRSADLDLYAVGWNRAGEELLKRGDLPGAERALLEAYHVRKLHHLAMDSSYCNLGRLKLAEGDLVSAAALLDRAVELAARPQSLTPAWDIYHTRGRVRVAQGRLREALADLRIAVRLARAWRWSAPADDAARIGAEGMIEQVHATLIEAGNRLYLETHDPSLAAETFEAMEENRASSLRALRSGDGTPPGVPPSYWEALARLQRAEIGALRSDGPAAAAVEKARGELMRLEASLGPAYHPPRAGLLARVRSALDANTALVGFDLAGGTSWLWALDRSGLSLYALPPRATIVAQASALTRAIRDDSSDAVPAGARLYETLFGQLAPRFRRKSRWLLALDQALFDVPFAALVEDGATRPVYVAERRATQVIPGAGFWVDAQTEAKDAAPPAGRFVGVGDPVYSTVDPRFQGRAPLASRAFFTGLFAATAPAGLPLPRLVGSAAEVEACARAWGGERVLLEGAAASGRGLAGQLRQNPAVVHLATHVLESPDERSQGMIALSIDGGGSPELLSPEAIAHWRFRTGLVVLSGCHSAAGAVLPGTGLMGLTRAWLSAGAQAVIASRWATPDDDGTLFHALYRRLGGGGRTGAAEALRQAQVEMLHTAGGRARPGYWAAYFLIGNQ